MQKGGSAAPWENASQMAVPFNHQPTSKTDWTSQEADEDGFAMQMSHVGGGGASVTGQAFPSATGTGGTGTGTGQQQQQYAPAGNESVLGGGPHARETVRSIDADPDPYNTESAAFAPPHSAVGRTLAQDSDAVSADQRMAGAAYAHARDAYEQEQREAFGPQPQAQYPPQQQGQGCQAAASPSPTAMIWVAVLCLVMAVIIGVFIVVSAVAASKKKQSQPAYTLL